MIAAIAVGVVAFSLAVWLCFAIVKQLKSPAPSVDPGQQVALDVTLSANEAAANQPKDEESEKAAREERNKRIGVLPRFVSCT